MAKKITDKKIAKHHKPWAKTRPRTWWQRIWSSAQYWDCKCTCGWEEEAIDLGFMPSVTDSLGLVKLTMKVHIEEVRAGIVPLKVKKAA